MSNILVVGIIVAYLMAMLAVVLRNNWLASKGY
jgi:hypothetical protein